MKWSLNFFEGFSQVLYVTEHYGRCIRHRLLKTYFSLDFFYRMGKQAQTQSIVQDKTTVPTKVTKIAYLCTNNIYPALSLD